MKRALLILALLLSAMLPTAGLLARQPGPDEAKEQATPTPPPGEQSTSPNQNTGPAPGHHNLQPEPAVPQDPWLENQAVAAMTPCVNGMAGGTYPCKGIDLQARVPLTTMSSGATAALSRRTTS